MKKEKMAQFNIGTIELDDKTAKKVQTLLDVPGITIQKLCEYCIKFAVDIHVQDNGNITRLSDR